MKYVSEFDSFQQHSHEVAVGHETKQELLPKKSRYRTRMDLDDVL